jgi:cytochrome P450
MICLPCRQRLIERARQALSQPDLPDGLLALIRDEWGLDGDIGPTILVNLLFAGHDTTSSTIVYLLWQLDRHPAVLAKVRGAAGTDLNCASIVFVDCS